jgi:hypothetical protein
MGIMLRDRRHLRLVIWALAFTLMSCATSGGNLEVGMRPDQAIAAMGQPDLKDTVPDPRGSGAGVLRYAWVARGKVATFGPDDRLAQVADLPAGTSAPNSSPASANTGGAAADSASAPIQNSFDPIQTPLNYLFYPLKFALTWAGAGINCVAEGSCHRPEVKPPDAG